MPVESLRISIILTGLVLHVTSCMLCSHTMWVLVGLCPVIAFLEFIIRSRRSDECDALGGGGRSIDPVVVVAIFWGFF